MYVVPQSLLVYAAGKSVYFVNLTASSAIQNQSDPPFLLDVKSDIVKIELDMENSRIFWIDKNGRLYGSMLDGTDWKVLVRAGKVFDMAVNHVTGQVRNRIIMAVVCVCLCSGYMLTSYTHVHLKARRSAFCLLSCMQAC